jgi:AAA+ ATPase superfamily predicted ATPase
MNPFPINNYIGESYFCDREVETKTLIDNINNQSNTTFFAQRRIGKTALIQHVFHQLKKKKVTCIYLDIYATQNIQEFTNQLANSIYQAVNANKSVGTRFWESIKILRPTISVDQITGTPELTLDISQTQQFEKTIPQLLGFLDAQKIKVVIAIDEFQQIVDYPEKNIEALLRTSIQQLKNVSFVFCGSNQKIMNYIFNSSKRPFYASTKHINLKAIEKEKYQTFIIETFTKHKFKIAEKEAELILSLTCLHTYYTQRLCHELFQLNDKNITQQKVKLALNKILLENEGIYFQYRSLLTPYQWRLLNAIASSDRIEQIYAQGFILQHKLGSSSNIKRGIEALIEKELVFHNISVEKPYFEVSDKFLMRWMQYKK